MVGSLEGIARPNEKGTFWCEFDWTSPLLQLFSSIERASSLHPLAIIPRKQLDVEFLDLARVMGLSFVSLLRGGVTESTARDAAVARICQSWECALVKRADKDSPGENTSSVAPFLSVRTAFDLYLKALALPRGSRVVCSPLTIPDMVTIILEHGLVPVPVDLDPNTLAPSSEVLEGEIRRTRGPCGSGPGGGEEVQGPVRAIYVAHVFGAQINMEPIAELAARYSLFLWEDCAQVFTGLDGYLGHPFSDVAFFSFGVIKRATALGGGVVVARDPVMLRAMSTLEATYPVQSSLSYLRRAIKCTLLLICTTPLLFGILVHVLTQLGVSHDEVIMKLSHGFPKKGMLKAIRHRPSVPLLQLLERRIARYGPQGLGLRGRHCNRMASRLARLLPLPGRAAKMGCSKVPELRSLLPGTQAHRHTLWLFPVVVPPDGEGSSAGVGAGGQRADVVVGALLREGFDATRAPTSLVPIDRCLSQAALGRGQARTEGCKGAVSPLPTVLPKCSQMMDSLVYLPLVDNIPDSEWDRMAFVLARALCQPLPLGAGGNGDCSTRRRIEPVNISLVLASFLLRVDVFILALACLLGVVPLCLACWLSSYSCS
ncbi:unnamed protein product [Discosporangium mesarthrocarpum]